MTYSHQSVLLEEALAALNIRSDGIYIDATFGRGGHSRRVLDQLGDGGRLIAIDKDIQAREHAQEQFGDHPGFEFVQGSFINIAQIAEDAGVMGKVDGVLMDLGVSSPQLDDADRGFSFRNDGPLDMRMDCSQGETAAQWLARVDASEIVWVLRDYGEERYAKRIARRIIETREELPLLRTLQLAQLIRDVVPRKWDDKKDPATRSFQAIRIHINKELDDLKLGLEKSIQVLKPTGRLVAISFHSLEDRIVKRYLRGEATVDIALRKLPIVPSDSTPRLRLLSKAIKPSQAEIEVNPRSRSAVMRVAETLL